MTRNYNSQLTLDDIEKNSLLPDTPRKNVDPTEYFKDNFPERRTSSRSIKRVWNQLSRLQRFVICMLFFFLILCIIVLLPWTDSSFLNTRPSNYVVKDRYPKKENLIIGFELDSHVNNVQLSTEVGKILNNEAIPRLKMEKVNYDGISNAFLKKIVKAAEEETGSLQEKQNAIVAAFVHAWKGYKNYAWGHDHLKPISKNFQNWFGVGLTIVDSLDTMFMMGLQDEFKEAKEWVKEKLSFNLNRDVNFFEITIRVMGGLLSAFHLSKDSLFLDKAVDLADRLMPGFRSSSGVPFSDVNLQTGHAHPPSWGQDSTVSEISTVQLEFRDLSYITGNPKYEKEAFKVSEHLHELPKKDGLVPMFINAESGKFRSTSTITVGARADSY